MLGSGENCEERKIGQKTDTKYDFSLAWFDKEKAEGKKLRKKVLLCLFSPEVVPEVARKGTITRRKSILKNQLYQTKF